MKTWRVILACLVLAAVAPTYTAEVGAMTPHPTWTQFGYALDKD